MQDVGEDYFRINFLNPIDCAQIMQGFTSCRFIYHDLFYMLQYHFIRHLRERPQSINTRTLTSMYLAHYTWARELVMSAREGNKQLKEMLPEFRNYSKQLMNEILRQI